MKECSENSVSSMWNNVDFDFVFQNCLIRKFVSYIVIFGRCFPAYVKKKCSTSFGAWTVILLTRPCYNVFIYFESVLSVCACVVNV